MLPGTPHKNAYIAIAFIVAALFPSVIWIAMDHSVWPWDQALYGEVSTHLWYVLLHQPASYPDAFFHAIGFKPPATVWLEQFFVPIGQAIGSIEAGLLLGVLFTQAITLWLAYRICRYLYPDQLLVAYCGIGVMASAPLFIAMNHQLFTESLQTAAVAYIFWIAARLHAKSSANAMGHLVLAAAIGLAAKTTTPFYCFVPMLYILIAIFRRHCAGAEYGLRRNDTILLALGIALLAATFAWYGINWAGVSAHVRDAMTTSFALDYGQIRGLGGKIAFWAEAFQKCFLLPRMFLLLGVAGLYAGVRQWLKKTPPAPQALAWLAWGSVAHCVYILGLFSLNIVEEPRYLLPLLPSVMVAATWAISQLPGRKWQWAILLCLGIQWGKINLISVGAVERISSATEWLWLPQRDDSKKIEAEKLVAITSRLGPNNAYVICGVEYSWLNANSLSFFAEKFQAVSGSRVFYTSLGYAEKDPEIAWKRVQTFNPIYFISVKELSQPSADFVNKISLAVLAKVKSDKHFTAVPFSSANGIVLFRHD